MCHSYEKMVGRTKFCKRWRKLAPVLILCNSVHKTQNGNWEHETAMTWIYRQVDLDLESTVMFRNTPSERKKQEAAYRSIWVLVLQINGAGGVCNKLLAFF